MESTRRPGTLEQVSWPSSDLPWHGRSLPLDGWWQREYLLTYVDGQGARYPVKALNDVLSATTLASACEAALPAGKAGIPPESFVEVNNASDGRSYPTEVEFPDYDRSFDEGVALEATSDKDFPMRMGSEISELWQPAAEEEYGPEGHTSISAFLEDPTRKREKDETT